MLFRSRISDEPIEKIGVLRTVERMSTVDLVFYVLEAGDLSVAEEFAEKLDWRKTVLIVNKMDRQPNFRVSSEIADRALAVLPVSATERLGLEALRLWLRSRLQNEVAEDSVAISNARHYQGLCSLRESLEKGLPMIRAGESPDLIALELQFGLRALHEVLGIAFDDQVMDRVFNEFCLGK